ncbi:MAG: PilW family protein [Deltaproteobacteria bacterium]|nr:PilW family protein [Deltaproteobacteria bacterium]
MAMIRKVRSKNTGFTMVELMVVLVILGIISVGAITSITGQNKVYHSEEDIIDMQMNARVAMQRICSTIRMAGYGCKDAFGPNLSSGNLVTNGDVAPNPLTNLLLISDNDSPTPDELTLAGAIKHVGTITAVPATNQITLDELRANIKSNGDVAAKSFIFVSPRESNIYQTVTGITGNTLTLLNPLTAAIDDEVYQVQAFTLRLTNNNLRVDDNVDTSSTNLEAASNIQDLQFQYGIDSDNDGEVNSWVDNTATLRQIKAVKIFILACTSKTDKEYTDRKTYTIAGITVGPFNDHFHRQLLESTIYIRNLNL